MFISIVYILVLFLSNKEFLITSILQTFIFFRLNLHVQVSSGKQTSPFTNVLQQGKMRVILG